MVDHCSKCGKEVEPGDVKCPACGAELPEPGDPPPPQNVAVIAATLLPAVGVVVFCGFIGAIVVAAMMFVRGVNQHHFSSTVPSAPSTSVPVQPMPAPMDSTPTMIVSQPATTAVPAPIAAAEGPPQPEAVIPTAPKATFPPPTLTDFTPAVVPPGQPLTLRGDSLGRVTTVILFDAEGAFRAIAPIVSKTENEVVVTVPPVHFADHGIYPAVFAPNGMAILAEEHLGNTPWGTDGHLHHTAVNVRTDDEIVTLDHMLVFAMPGSVVCLGDNSVGFFSNNVTLKAVGKNCTVYYVDPLQRPADESKCRFVKKPSIELDVNGEAFRVKPAAPG